MAAELGTADVALAPAPAETFGLAALEALACGTPVVAHAGAAPAEVIAQHPGSGEVAAGVPGAFADSVLRLAATPRGVRRDGARAAAENYPWSATISAALALRPSRSQNVFEKSHPAPAATACIRPDFSSTF